jgi:DNA-binding beta-propeller fold protein YncE
MSDISTDSSLAWVAFDGDHSVLPVPSLALRSPFFHEGQTFAVPGSDALAVTEAMLWVLDAAGERVFPVDLVTDRVGTPISVGSHPTSVALDGGFLWVANERSVSRIDGTTHSLSTTALPRHLSSSQ